MRKVLIAARLFFLFCAANAKHVGTHLLFSTFAQLLYRGSISKTGDDPSGLFWRPQDAQEAQNIIGRLTDLFVWVNDVYGEPTVKLPRLTGGRFDHALDELAYQYRRDQALLGHTWQMSRGSSADGKGHVEFGMYAFRKPTVKGSFDKQPAFPDARFNDLMTQGFAPRGRIDYRGRLLTLLMHGGGLRPSECFQVFVDDVTIDHETGMAVVLVHHPSAGGAPSDWQTGHPKVKYANREEYLKIRWGLTPRHRTLKSTHAGWKGGAHQRKRGAYFFRVHWFPPQHGRDFAQLWHHYLIQLSKVRRDHPYAFVNLNRGLPGGIYKYSRFRRAHADAIRRIGLPVSKALGTTEHGHRHAYAQRLKRAKVPEEVIRRCMHHSSVQSQETYTAADIDQVLDALSTSLSSIERRHASSEAVT